MPSRKTTNQSRIMSDIMKDMAERLLVNADAAHSSQAVYVALFFANPEL